MSILIDELVECQAYQQTEVEIDNTKKSIYRIAKPLNYEKEYTTFLSRLKDAIFVLKGKAIAVQFFTDLSNKDQAKYYKNKSREQEKYSNTSLLDEVDFDEVDFDDDKVKNEPSK